MFEWIFKYWVEVLFGLVTTGFIAFVKLQISTNKAIRLGLQAILRDRLLQSFNACLKDGCTTYEERQNWINMYNQYHTLGANGVMDDIKEKFLSLPIKPAH